MCEKISFTFIILISLWLHQEIHPLNAGMSSGNYPGDSGLHRAPAQNPVVASKINARHKKRISAGQKVGVDILCHCWCELEWAGKARYKFPADNLAAGLFISMALHISPCQEQLKTLRNIKCSSCCKSSLSSSKPCCKPWAWRDKAWPEYFSIHSLWSTF